MKIVTLLLTFIVVFNFTSATIEGPVTSSEPAFEDIPDGSPIYLQTGQNSFLSGILQREPINYLAMVFVQIRNELNLSAGLHTIHPNTNYISREYRCYIPLPNGTFLTAHLHTYAHRVNVQRRMNISIRFSAGRTLFVGELRRGVGALPAWIPRQNTK